MARSQFAKHKAYFQHLITSGGPQKRDYSDLSNFYKEVWHQLQEGVYTPDDIKSLNWLMTEEGLNNTMQGRSFLKKHGYAGDFEIIDHIYQSKVSSHPQFANWDVYYHAQASAIAVRNRKNLFKNTLSDLKPKASVLNFASGPCRDLFEYFNESTTPNDPVIECVEGDAKAIDYAKQLLAPLQVNIHFIQKNVLRYRPKKQFDLIWSSGLFDYFNDKVFVRLLDRMNQWLRPGGQIIIGNFAQGNPTQPYMEFVEWSIHHRSKQDLAQLASTAGFHSREIEVILEDAGVNYFLRLRKGS